MISCKTILGCDEVELQRQARSTERICWIGSDCVCVCFRLFQCSCSLITTAVVQGNTHKNTKLLRSDLFFLRTLSPKIAVFVWTEVTSSFMISLFSRLLFIQSQPVTLSSSQSSVSCQTLKCSSLTALISAAWRLCDPSPPPSSEENVPLHHLLISATSISSDFSTWWPTSCLHLSAKVDSRRIEAKWRDTLWGCNVNRNLISIWNRQYKMSHPWI